MFADAQEAIDFIETQGIEYVDVRFCDLLGVQQHLTVPAEEFCRAGITDGLMFDGSSIRGFAAIHESDMKLIPDLSSAYVDPFRAAKTLIILFSIVDPFTDEPFSRDPRQVAAKAEAFLRATGIADTCFVGAEAEFFIFDDVRYQVSQNHTFYALDSSEAPWNAATIEPGGNLGYRLRNKGGYSPVSPSITTMICVTRWPRIFAVWACILSVLTMSAAPQVSMRLTIASRHSWRQLTT